MKTKLIILVALTAIVTLSFTFASNNKADIKSKDTVTKETSTEPSGGFVSEDKF